VLEFRQINKYISESRLIFSQTVKKLIDHEVDTVAKRFFDQSRLDPFKQSCKESFLSDDTDKCVHDPIVFIFAIKLVLESDSNKI